jgi:hypothetical protein
LGAEGSLQRRNEGSVSAVEERPFRAAKAGLNTGLLAVATRRISKPICIQDLCPMEKSNDQTVLEETPRYSPASCIGCDPKVVSGDLDPKNMSTSFVERQNLTLGKLCALLSRSKVSVGGTRFSFTYLGASGLRQGFLGTS